MQSKATTVAAYLASLPADRRAALEAVRKAINDNLDPTYREGMSYGMIGWCIPHEVYPAGYHCNPALPLPYAGLASQKGHMSLYMMGLYIDADRQETDLVRWFREAWTKTGRKLDMGKACVRFKKIEDVPLEVVGEAIRRMPAKEYLRRYESALATMKSGASRAPAKKAAPAKKSVAKQKATNRSSSKAAKVTKPSKGR